MKNPYLQIALVIIIIIVQFVNQLVFPLPIIIMCFLILLAFILIERELLLGLFCLLIPISTNPILYFANILFVFTLLIKFRSYVKLNMSILFILSIALIESIHVFRNINNGAGESVIILLGFILCLAPFSFINSISNYFNKVKTIELFFLGYMSFTVITFIKYYINFGTLNIFNNVQRFGFVENPKEADSGSLIINPNTIGIYSALIITIILVLIYFKILKINVKSIFIFSFSMLIGLMTLSRTFLLMLTVVLVIYILISIRKRNIIALSGIIVAFFAIIINFLLNPQLLEMLKKRLFESDDISGSRFSIYEEYLKIIFSNDWLFTFGIGMQDYLVKIGRFNALIDQATHNVVLEVLTIWGVLGLVLVVCLFGTIILNSDFWRSSSLSDSLVKLLPCIAVIVSIQFGQFFISFYHTFAILILAIIFLNVKAGVEVD